MWFSKKKDNLIFIFSFSLDYLDWIDLKNPNYDLILVDAQENRWANIHKLIDEHKAKISKYKSISFMDSDVKSTSSDIEEYFRIFNKYKLNYSSPSYRSPDFFSQKQCLMRDVNCLPDKFITFNYNSLVSIKKYLLFNSSGSGIEWLLPKEIGKGVSIIDKIVLDNDYDDKNKKIVIKDLIKIYNELLADNLYFVEYSRIDHEEQKSFCCFPIGKFELIDTFKFKRPSRRSNSCCNTHVTLSNRMINSTIENIQ